ncbi:MAG: hypothetical protein V3T01_08740 [Myxococcota bacterium]
MSRAKSRALQATLFAVGALLLLSVYGQASSVPRGVDLMRHGSGIYDMDVARVVADLTTRLPAYRPSVHPLQKLFVAPVGQWVNTRFFAGRDRLASAKILVAGFVTLNALCVGWLAFALSRRSRIAGVAASAVCGVSFSSILAASIPESAAVSCLGSVVPLILLEARSGRRLGWGEAIAWGLVGVFCFAITITQIVFWVIALAVRCWLLWRSAGGAVDAGPLAIRLALALGLAASLAWAGTRLQSRLYPGTEPFTAAAPFESARGYFRVAELRDAPLRHTGLLAGHFVLYSFVAPRPAYSDFLMRDFGHDYWSLSIENSDWEHWTPAPRALAALLVMGMLVAGAVRGRVDVHFLAPGLGIASQFALHLVYGREYILYSPNWHGVLVAVFTAAAWNGWGQRRNLFIAVAAVVCTAMLLNNLAVMDAVYREFGAGLEAIRRDATGNLLPGID